MPPIPIIITDIHTITGAPTHTGTGATDTIIMAGLIITIPITGIQHIIMENTDPVTPNTTATKV